MCDVLLGGATALGAGAQGNGPFFRAFGGLLRWWHAQPQSHAAKGARPGADVVRAYARCLRLSEYARDHAEEARRALEGLPG